MIFQEERRRVEAAHQAAMRSLEQQRLEIEERIKAASREELSELERQKQEILGSIRRTTEEARKEAALPLTPPPPHARIREEAERAVERAVVEPEVMLERAEREALTELEEARTEAISEAMRQKIEVLGEIGAAERKWLNENVQLPTTGEWISRVYYEELPEALQTRLSTLGVVAFNDWIAKEKAAAEAAEQKWLGENVQLGTDEWVSRDYYEGLPEDLQTRLSTLGVTEYNVIQERELAAYEAALAEVAPFKVGEDAYDLTAALKAGVAESALLTVGFDEAGISEARTASAENILLPSGEWVSEADFAELTPEDRALITTVGIAAFTQQKEQEWADFTAKHIQVGPAEEWISEADYEALNVPMQQVIKEQGLAGMSLEGLSGEEVFDKYREWEVIPKDSVYIEGGYDPETLALTTIPKDAWDELSPAVQEYVQTGGEEALEQLATAGVVEVADKILPATEWEGMKSSEQFKFVYGDYPTKDEYVAFSMSKIDEQPMSFWLSIAAGFQEFWPGESDLERRQKLHDAFTAEYWKEFPEMMYDPGAYVGEIGAIVFPPARALHPWVGVSEITPFEWGMGALNVALLAAPIWLPKVVSPIHSARYVREFFGIAKLAKDAGRARVTAGIKIAQLRQPIRLRLIEKPVTLRASDAHRAVVKWVNADARFAKKLTGLKALTSQRLVRSQKFVRKLVRLEELSGVTGLKNAVLKVAKAQGVKDKAAGAFRAKKFTEKDWWTPRYQNALKRVDTAHVALEKAALDLERLLVPKGTRTIGTVQGGPLRIAELLAEEGRVPRLTYGMTWKPDKPLVPEAFEEAFEAPIRAGMQAVATKVAAKPKFWELQLKPKTAVTEAMPEIAPKPTVTAPAVKPTPKVKVSVFPGLTKPKITVKTATRTETLPLERLHRMTPEQFQRLFGSESVQIGVYPYPLIEVTASGAVRLAQQMYTAVELATQTAVEAAEQAANQAVVQAAIQIQAQALTQAQALAMVQAQARAAAEAAVETFAETQTQAQAKAAVKVATAEIVRVATKTATKDTDADFEAVRPPLPSPPGKAVVKRKVYPAGTAVFLMGWDWKILPPPYTLRKHISSKTPPAGVTRLTGTPQQTLTFIGGVVPFSDVAFDLGVVDGFIDVANKRIVFRSDWRMRTDVGERIPGPTKGLSLKKKRGRRVGRTPAISLGEIRIR